MSSRPHPRPRPAALCLLLWLPWLPALAALRVDATVAGRQYAKSNLSSQGGVQGHIVKGMDGLLFAKWSDDRLYFRKSSALYAERVDGVPEGSVYDVLQTPAGLVWVATGKGLYHYNATSNRAMDAGITRECIIHLSLSGAGELHVGHYSYVVSVLRGRTLARVAGLEAWRLAFARDDSAYYCASCEGPVVVRRGGLAQGTAPKVLQGLPAGYTWLLEVDRLSDVLFVGHSEGLFHVRHGKGSVARVEGIPGTVWALGVYKNVIYVGRHNEILKLWTQEAADEAPPGRGNATALRPVKDGPQTGPKSGA